MTRKRIPLRRGLVLLLPVRRRTDEVPLDAFLLVGLRRVNLDRLPPHLARLLPSAYAHARAAAFEPLVRAIELEGP